MYQIVHAIMYTIVKIAAKLLGRLRVTGVENVPKTGALIYCPNHQSDADPAVMLVSIPRRAWFVGKEELFRIPLAKSLFRALHGIPIKRDSPDRAALRSIEEKLKRGEPVLIFPEGRCSHDGRLLRMQPGAAMLALRTGASIVPVGVKHTNELLPYGSLWPRPSREPVTVEFGKPIDAAEFENLPKRERIDAFTERVGREIAKLVGQEPPSTVSTETESETSAEAA